MSPSSNDNYTFPTQPLLDEPLGRAALLLVESLIHVLKERGVLTSELAVEVAETAYEAADDRALELGLTEQPLELAVLAGIRESLMLDAPSD